MLRVTLVVACLCAASHAGVLVLDAAGGGDFTTLQQVVDAAQDGDIVLVRPGDYEASNAFPGATFGNIGLTIVADGTGPVDFPSLRITGIPAGKTFVLRGVRLVNDVDFGPVFFRLQVDGSQGVTVVEDCYIGGIDDTFISLPAQVVRVLSASLALEDCDIVGSPGKDFITDTLPANQGNWGLYALAARVSLADCTLAAGSGGDELTGVSNGAAAGGTGIFSIGSQLQISGCTITGGAGGHDTGAAQPSGAAAGGAGLIADVPSLVRLRDSTVSGGAGGTDASGVPGPDGVAIDAPAGVIVQLPGPARTVHIDAPLAEGDSGQLLLGGEPGELAVLLVSFEGTWFNVPKFGGPLLVGAPAFAPWVLGTLDGSGELQVGFVAPHFGLSPDTGMRVVLQVITSGGAATVLGDASAFVEQAGP